MVSRVIQNQALKDKLKLFISPQLKHLLDLLSSDILFLTAMILSCPSKNPPPATGMNLAAKAKVGR